MACQCWRRLLLGTRARPCRSLARAPPPPRLPPPPPPPLLLLRAALAESCLRLAGQWPASRQSCGSLPRRPRWAGRH